MASNDGWLAYLRELEIRRIRVFEPAIKHLRVWRRPRSFKAACMATTSDLAINKVLIWNDPDIWDWSRERYRRAILGI